jgi:hypothetical protein
VDRIPGLDGLRLMKATVPTTARWGLDLRLYKSTPQGANMAGGRSRLDGTITHDDVKFHGISRTGAETRSRNYSLFIFLITHTCGGVTKLPFVCC